MSLCVCVCVRVFPCQRPEIFAVIQTLCPIKTVSVAWLLNGIVNKQAGQRWRPAELAPSGLGLLRTDVLRSPPGETGLWARLQPFRLSSRQQAPPCRSCSSRVRSACLLFAVARLIWWPGEPRGDCLAVKCLLIVDRVVIMWARLSSGHTRCFCRRGHVGAHLQTSEEQLLLSANTQDPWCFRGLSGAEGSRSAEKLLKDVGFHSFGVFFKSKFPFQTSSCH